MLFALEIDDVASEGAARNVAEDLFHARPRHLPLGELHDRHLRSALLALNRDTAPWQGPVSRMSGRDMHDQPPGRSRPCPAGPPGPSHDTLRLALMTAGRLVRASADDPDRFPAARENMARFCFAELLPHLVADEAWLLEARDCPEARLLVDAMRTEARAMTAAVYELAAATESCQAVAATRVLHALLAAHAHHEELLVRHT